MFVCSNTLIVCDYARALDSNNEHVQKLVCFENRRFKCFGDLIVTYKDSLNNSSINAMLREREGIEMSMLIVLLTLFIEPCMTGSAPRAVV